MINILAIVLKPARPEAQRHGKSNSTAKLMGKVVTIYIKTTRITGRLAESKTVL